MDKFAEKVPDVLNGVGDGTFSTLTLGGSEDVACGPPTRQAKPSMFNGRGCDVKGNMLFEDVACRPPKL